MDDERYTSCSDTMTSDGDDRMTRQCTRRNGDCSKMMNMITSTSSMNSDAKDCTKQCSRRCVRTTPSQHPKRTIISQSTPLHESLHRNHSSSASLSLSSSLLSLSSSSVFALICCLTLFGCLPQTTMAQGFLPSYSEYTSTFEWHNPDSLDSDGLNVCLRDR